jgi:hypothetical protein
MDHHVDTPQRDALQALLDATANYLGNADRDLLTPLGVTLPVPEMPKTAAWFRAARVTLTVAAKKTDVPAYGIGDVQQAFEKVVQEVRLP